MSMTSSPGNQSGGMGGKSMGGPNTTGPGGYGNNYDGNPNQGGMPTQFAAGGPGMGIGMDYRNLGGDPNQGGGMQQPSPGLPSTGMGGNMTPGLPSVGQGGGMFGGPANQMGFFGLPSTGMGGGKGMGPVGGMLPGIIGGQMPPGGAELVGGAYGRPIFGGGTQPIDGSTSPGIPNRFITAGDMLDPANAGRNINEVGMPFNPTPVFGGGQQQPITAGTGQLPPGFGALSPIDRSQIGSAQIGMTNRFAPPNAAGVRRAPAAAVSRTNASSPARVAQPITRSRSR